MSESWTSAYIATSALLGESLDATLDSMGPHVGSSPRSLPSTGSPAGTDAVQGGPLPAPAAALAKTLRSGSREIRAQALARALSEVVLALDAVRLA